MPPAAPLPIPRACPGVQRAAAGSTTLFIMQAGSLGRPAMPGCGASAAAAAAAAAAGCRHLRRRRRGRMRTSAPPAARLPNRQPGRWGWSGPWPGPWLGGSQGGGAAASLTRRPPPPTPSPLRRRCRQGGWDARGGAAAGVPVICPARSKSRAVRASLGACGVPRHASTNTPQQRLGAHRGLAAQRRRRAAP